VIYYLHILYEFHTWHIYTHVWKVRDVYIHTYIIVSSLHVYIHTYIIVFMHIYAHIHKGYTIHMCYMNSTHDISTHTYEVWIIHSYNACTYIYIYIYIHTYVYRVQICKWCTICTLCCSVLQCVAVCCSVLQCGVACCSVLQCGYVNDTLFAPCVAVCCSVLRCVAVCCSVVLRVAVCCSVDM